MKKYDQENFNRYRDDLKSSQPEGKFYDEYTRDELIIKFMPLVENLARKFSTSEQASGVMTVVDMIQEGSVGLIKAVDKIIWPTIFEAEDPEKRLKSFLANRDYADAAVVVEIRSRRRNNLPITQSMIDKISDPGNMGTLIRSCAWFGIKNIALSPQCVDPYNPKTVRAAMGAHFLVTIQKRIDLTIFKETHKIIAANLDGFSASTYIFPDKCVLVLSNEAHGISDQNQNCIEDYIFIDKIGSGNSLNVSVAGSVLMYLMMKS